MSARSIINHDDSVPGGADTKKKDNKDTHLRWPPLTKTLLVKGDEVITFPFLEDENLKDLYLVRSLLAERPYKAGYGGTAKAWEDVAVQLRDVKHPESGDLLYGPKTLKAKTLKDRFMLYMAFVQKQDRKALRRTGTDDDPVPTEIMSALEDLYSDWKSHCATGESKSQAVAAQKKKDRDAAEAVRQASLGNLTAMYGADELSDDLDSDCPVPKETPTSNRRLSYGLKPMTASSSVASSRSRSPVFSGQHNEALQDLLSRSQEREEARARSKRARLELEKTKEERESRRLQIEEERLHLEERRLELDRAERKASIQLMQALAESLLSEKNKNNSTQS